MKKIIIPLGIFSLLVLITFAGCMGIPLGEEIDSETVYGKGENAEILQRKIRKNRFFLISPEGGGEKYCISTRYFIKSNDKIISLPHLGNAKEENDSGFCYKIEKPIHSVANTGMWIAAQKYYMEGDHVGINLIIFDKDKIIKKMKIPNCLRSGHFSGTYGLEYKDGNTKIIFHTTEGKYLLDIPKDTYKKL